MESTLGFETIFETTAAEQMIFNNLLPEETYCPDCYDCDYNCTDAN